MYVQLENVPIGQARTPTSGAVKHPQFQILSLETMRFPVDIFEHGNRTQLGEPGLSSLYPLNSSENCLFDIARGRSTGGCHSHVSASMHADGQVTHSLVR